jgi:DEAD/DEAH box helicase domain-containing protein
MNDSRIAEFITRLHTERDDAGQMVHVQEIAARPAHYAPTRRPLNPALQAALEQRGIRRLYSHQAAAIDLARDGRDVVVVTGTASGKTLCYNAPVLEAALADPMARALYLFPTKALAQDQLRTLGELTAHEALRGIRYGAYDGDTLQGARARIRRQAHVILSNPDMLSMGILPNHAAWATFFRHLRYVVLDEAHAYRGVLGSHVACLLRRLRRVCALYGATPRFILCSATIANAGEHAARLIGREVDVVDDDGAPQGPRRFVLWNPPYIDQGAGERRSIHTEASGIMAAMVADGLRNITFVRARKVAELLLIYTRDALRQRQPDLADRISAYRGGYLPAERREIERQLFSGELLGVAATNALELGIDVGQLDATLLVGYPGTIASTRQQAGRAGRDGRESLTILVGQNNPLDQYFMRHPQELFSRTPEHALIDPGNEYILADHLACAAFESPLAPQDEALFGPGYGDATAALLHEGTLTARGDRLFYQPEDYPAQRVNLRGAGGAPFLLVDESSGRRVLEEIDAATAPFRVYPGGIYLHRGESYLITRLDTAASVAVARRIEADYYTQPRELNDVSIVRSHDVRLLPATEIYFGRVRVTQQVIGFRRMQQFSGALLDEEPLDLPPTSFETQALWWEVSGALRAQVVAQGLDFNGGLHAVEHACIGVLPLLAMCDRDDIGGVSTPAHPDTERPQVFIYDGYPGGVGITRKGFEAVEDLWWRALDAVENCPCESGCPSCIHSFKCGNNNEPLDKAAAVMILRGLLGQQPPGS